MRRDLPASMAAFMILSRHDSVGFLALDAKPSQPASKFGYSNAVEPIDDLLVEPTKTVTITIEPPVCLSVYPPPPYAVSGTASNGVDYETLPGCVIIPAGERRADIRLIPREDNEI